MVEVLTCQVIEITRGTTHDGPGMRTNVFLKGCPLCCLWCQNPEGIKAVPEVWWEERKCIHCLACSKTCTSGSITEESGGMQLNRETCTLCGACVEVCPSLAMSFNGQEWTIDTLVKEALKDRDYYQAFGGGVTVSGGEPLSQYRFVAEFFKRLHKEGVHTALDTCGLAPVEALDAVLPYTDHVLYDIKILDSDLHKQYTAHANSRILANLALIAETIRKVNRDQSRGMKLWIRTPLIPETTATQENIKAISHYIFDNIMDVTERWELCAFNSACKTKYKKMGLSWAYEGYELMRQPYIDTIKEAALSTGIADEILVISGLIAKAGASTVGS